MDGCVRVMDVPYLVPLRDGRLVLERLPFFVCRGTNFPIGPFQSVMAVADLQGAVLRMQDGGALITEALYDQEVTVDELFPIVQELGVEVIPAAAVVPEVLERFFQELAISEEGRLYLLAGDLCGELERGATCDVTDHWNAFGQGAAQVLGVLGNHDLVEVGHLAANVRLLDGEVWWREGLGVGGISGIVGRKSRNPWNRDREEFRKVLGKVLAERPPVLLLHPPPALDRGYAGEPVVWEMLRDHPVPIHVICGHKDWPERRVRRGHVEIWNVEGAVVVFLGDD